MFKKSNYLTVLILAILGLSQIFSQNTKEIVDSVNSISYETVVSNLLRYEKIFNDNLIKSRYIGYSKGEGLSLSKLALVYYLKGNYDKSTQYHIESFKIFSDNKMYIELSEAYGEFGYELKRRDLDKAIEYMQVAIRVADDHAVPRKFKSKLYDNYGVLKEMQNDADSAIYFYKKALEIKKSHHDLIGIPYSLNKIAVLKANQGKFSEAYTYLSLSDSIRNKENGDFGRMENMAFHGDFLMKQKKYEDAIIAYQSALEMAVTLNYSYMILYCYDNLTELFKQKKDINNAFNTFRKYTIYKDSLDNIELNSKVAQLEIAYETEQKNKLIADGKYQLKNRNQQLTFAIITLILLVLIFIGIFKYQQQKRKRIVEKLELKSKLNNAELEKKLVDEKLKISRELHDNIGSQLTFIISSLDNLSYTEKSNKLLPKLNTIRDFSRDALLDLRSTIWAMKQEDGNLETLTIKINEMISKLNTSLSNFEFTLINSIEESIKLSSIQILNLFRIVQEALQNSIKYSEATKVKIKFEKIIDGFEIQIEDNGIGFDNLVDKSGNGLINMEARCRQAGGEFIISNNNPGTLICCKLKT